MHVRDKSETYTKTHVAVAYSPQSRKADHPPCRRNMSITHAVVVGKGILLAEIRSATQTSETIWTFPLEQQTLEIQENGNYEEDEMTNPQLCQSRQREHYWYHVLLMRRKKK